MQAYLAEKYMTGPKADAILARAGGDKKKKKRKAVATTYSATAGPSFITDDDVSGFARLEQVEEDDEMKDAVVASDRGFKKRRTDGPAGSGTGSSGWQTVRDGAKKDESPAPDEKPQVVDEPVPTPFTGGLVTRAQLAKSRPAPKQEQPEQTADEIAAQQETVYRDASGKKIDMKAERAEAARKKREREEREAKKMEWGKGLVQRNDEEKMRQDLEKMKTQDVARYRDDKELNEEQRAAERWNDPAAAFITKKRNKGPRRPEYAGPPPPPNRFGIKPGYRWDGVDRGNGFEQKLFQRINERKRKGAESYSWSVDDM